MSTIQVIIVAAGSGLRYGAPLPKQFCELDGRPVVMHTIEAFRRNMPQAAISLVISSEMNDLWLELCKTYNFISPRIVFGGSTRWESVKNAVDSTAEAGIIMIHDAVRPIVDKEMLDRLTNEINSTDCDGALPAISVTDTVRQVSADGSSKTLNRSSLRAVQTPQTFSASKLKQAYMLPYSETFTDDASVMEAAGFTDIRLVEGSPRNIKITRPGDIEIASLYLKK